MDANDRAMILAHLLTKIDKGDGLGCWLWTDHTTSRGYGKFTFRRKTFSAHRFIYSEMVGPIPDGMVIDHVVARGCTSTRCVRPDHLEPVTQQENFARGRSRGAALSATGICSRGHDSAVTGIYTDPRGRRQCAECTRVTKIEYRHANKVMLAEKNRAFRESHREYLRAYNREYKRSHRKRQAG